MSDVPGRGLHCRPQPSNSSAWARPPQSRRWPPSGVLLQSSCQGWFRNGYSTRAGREKSPVRESRAQSPHGARRSHHAGHETNAHRRTRVPQSGQESARLPYPTLETSDDARHSTSVWATPPVAATTAGAAARALSGASAGGQQAVCGIYLPRQFVSLANGISVPEWWWGRHGGPVAQVRPSAKVEVRTYPARLTMRATRRVAGSKITTLSSGETK